MVGKNIWAKGEGEREFGVEERVTISLCIGFSLKCSSKSVF